MSAIDLAGMPQTFATNSGNRLAVGFAQVHWRLAHGRSCEYRGGSYYTQVSLFISCCTSTTKPADSCAGWAGDIATLRLVTS
jgi:hypothetical protein